MQNKDIIIYIEGNCAYGPLTHWDNGLEFAEKVKKEWASENDNEHRDCEITKLSVEKCIFTKENIPGDCLVPVSAVDCIEWYWKVEIEEIESETAEYCPHFVSGVCALEGTGEPCIYEIDTKYYCSLI